jgi:hypothetical protein
MSQTLLVAPRAFTTESTAHLLGMSPEEVRYRIRRKQIRAARIGRQLFVPAVEIDRLLTPESVGEVTAQCGGATGEETCAKPEHDAGSRGVCAGAQP